MEAVVKQVRSTKRPWLIACDANICPEDFKKSLWFQIRHVFRGARRRRFIDPKAQTTS